MPIGYFDTRRQSVYFGRKTEDEKKPEATKAETGPVSFLKDVAPILVQNCIACHNPKKSESKYTMTTFAQLAKGGQQGEGITLEPGDPDASFLVELIRRPDAIHLATAEAFIFLV